MGVKNMRESPVGCSLGGQTRGLHNRETATGFRSWAEDMPRTLDRDERLLRSEREMHPTPPSVCPLKLLVHSCICSEEAKCVPWGGWPVIFFAPECRTIWQLLVSDSVLSELLVSTIGKVLHSRILAGFSVCLVTPSESQASTSEAGGWDSLGP